ncbi:hypothetical protein CLU95_0907 [Variovorax sp. 54]|nr:hypothetical protein CLU95_0907 [Variovorax sp. 54]
MKICLAIHDVVRRLRRQGCGQQQASRNARATLRPCGTVAPWCSCALAHNANGTTTVTDSVGRATTYHYVIRDGEHAV